MRILPSMQKPPIAECAISTDGFIFRIRFFAGWTQGNDALRDVYLDLESDIVYVHPHSHWRHACDGYCTRADIIEMAQYIEDHVSELPIVGPSYDVITFPQKRRRPFQHLGAGYSICALPGEREPDGTGYFTLRVLVDTGSGCKSRTNVSVGGEALVAIPQALRFATELRAVVDGSCPPSHR